MQLPGPVKICKSLLKGPVIPALINAAQGQVGGFNANYSCTQTRHSNDNLQQNVVLPPNQEPVDDEVRLTNSVLSPCMSPMLATRPRPWRGTGGSMHCKWYQLSLGCTPGSVEMHVKLSFFNLLLQTSVSLVLHGKNHFYLLPDFELLDFIA